MKRQRSHDPSPKRADTPATVVQPIKAQGSRLDRVSPHPLRGIIGWLLTLGIITACAEIIGADSRAWPDISTVPADLEVPPRGDAAPGPGLRVKQTLPAWRQTAVYHVLYLPQDWQRKLAAVKE